MLDCRSLNLLGALVVSIHDKMTEVVEGELGMGGQAPAALVTITHNPGESVAFLSGALRLSHPGCVRLVDKLVRAGLVERGEAQDKRFVSLTLSAAGRRCSQEILRARRRTLEVFMQPLRRQQQIQLTELLEIMLRETATTKQAGDAACRLCEEQHCPQPECPITQGFTRNSASAAGI
ncbi:MAG TPA: MarR family winged helix-turn-helix transcriptional regulator [Steroidobacteraceae bacterium]|jgi:DNA-binding MarR family transcriptional regulator